MNTFIIVWRESLEAMLIVGILLAWSARQENVGALRRSLWSGVLGGIALALALGWATLAAQSQFSGTALEVFQLALLFFAVLLIVQMVLWMHRHGRHMKRELESRADAAVGCTGVALVAALAVAREGAETVVFLTGLSADASITAAQMLLPALAGFMLAALTAWALARGARFLSFRAVFRLSEIFLLLIANALLATGIDRLIGMDWLSPLLDPAFDISYLLPDGHGVGRILADFAGYRARPAGLLVLVCLAYWVYVIWRLRRMDQAAAV